MDDDTCTYLAQRIIRYLDAKPDAKVVEVPLSRHDANVILRALATHGEKKEEGE